MECRAALEAGAAYCGFCGNVISTTQDAVAASTSSSHGPWADLSNRWKRLGTWGKGLIAAGGVRVVIFIGTVVMLANADSPAPPSSPGADAPVDHIARLQSWWNTLPQYPAYEGDMANQVSTCAAYWSLGASEYYEEFTGAGGPAAEIPESDFRQFFDNACDEFG